MNARERFFEKVWPEPNSGCWLWAGQPNNGGYGRVTNEEGKVMLAHRYSYRSFVDAKVPPVVMHKCDNPCCVNPQHLVGGSQTANMKDMWSKGRGKTPKITRSNCHLTRYTASQINLVKHLRGQGLTQMEIKNKTGISQSHISRILQGEVK